MSINSHGRKRGQASDSASVRHTVAVSRTLSIVCRFTVVWLILKLVNGLSFVLTRLGSVKTSRRLFRCHSLCWFLPTSKRLLRCFVGTVLDNDSLLVSHIDIGMRHSFFHRCQVDHEGLILSAGKHLQASRSLVGSRYEIY